MSQSCVDRFSDENKGNVMKICSQCKILKETTNFYNNTKKPDKLQNMCKTCTKNNDKKRIVSGENRKRMSLYYYNITTKKMQDPAFRRDYNAYKALQKRTSEARAKLRQKYATNLQERLSQIIRTRIRAALITGAPKSDNTLKLLGCSVIQLKKHLVSKFTDGMTWKNYGKWHIDHIAPCASFNLDSTEEQKRCFHFSNLQPLWATDNLKKSGKIV